MPPGTHDAVCRRRAIAHLVLLVVPAIMRGARSAGVAGPIWRRRLDAQIVPPCAFQPARWLAKSQGVAGGTEQIRGR